MKRILFIAVFLITAATTAQNFQTHYDFDREHITTTFELFKPDKYGNTFTFIDFDYNAESGINQAYFEIARVLKTEKMPVGLHLEYNGGLGTFDVADTRYGYTINSAWLVGVNYGVGNAQWGFTTYAAYKAFNDAGKGNFQLTGVWYVNFANNKLTFNGFADLWTEKGLSDRTVFLTEPQLWFHLNNSFSVGGEVEISNNFAGFDSFEVRPTLGLKWNI